MTTETGALRGALIDGFRSTLDSVLPWFMSQMPAFFTAAIKSAGVAFVKSTGVSVTHSSA